MNILVLGLGVSGRAAAEFLLNRFCDVTALDQKGELLANDPDILCLIEKGLIVKTNLSFEEISNFQQVVISPGVPCTHQVIVDARHQGIEVIGEIELACRYLKQPMIAITGTNGKTTVTQLIGHVLNACGKPARVLGNGGVPLISEIENLDQEIVVCELSSYQLETLQSQVVDVGAILNITPDHLDRYSSMNAYAKAKWRLSSCLKKGAKLIISEQVMSDYGHFSSVSKENIELFTPDNYNGSLNHDEENRLAAKKMCLLAGVSSEEFDSAEKSFTKPPHRIEFVRNYNGVAFFNDSKGTNLDSVKRAVEKMDGPVVLIAGGKEKGTRFTSWIDPFKNKVKTIVAIGEAKKTITNELGEFFTVIEKDDLNSAVELASTIAVGRDNVLFSPGCSSFDMFKNFEERGNHFKECVWILD